MCIGCLYMQVRALKTFNLQNTTVRHYRHAIANVSKNKIGWYLLIQVVERVLVSTVKGHGMSTTTELNASTKWSIIVLYVPSSFSSGLLTLSVWCFLACSLNSVAICSTWARGLCVCVCCTQAQTHIGTYTHRHTHTHTPSPSSPHSYKHT